VAKILFAEDDIQLASIVIDYLKSQQHIVEHVVDGNEAQTLLKLTRFEIIILDWELPGMTGIDICRNFRAAGGASRILLLTGKQSIDHKEAGLDAGADDYLTKPFEIRELAARLRSLLRRPDKVVDNVLTCGRLTVDTATLMAFKDGQHIQLFPKEYAILEFLMRNPDQVFSLEAMQERIWPSSSETSPQALRVHIFRLRSKIQSKNDREIIRTAFRTGYLLDSAAAEQ
jgi:DNA-binding response OmpR family regulator